jgi:3-phenylpropionate/trans-cinnamate dioxygenase ferredoxin reductase subunit
MVIIGGGQAGAQAVDSLRREGFQGRLVLVSEETELPYQRPPLSKKFLSGELTTERLWFRHQGFYDEHRAELLLGAKAARIDRVGRRVWLADGRDCAYDRLLLCLGATSRRLSCGGAELEGVHYLRGLTDAIRLKEAIRPGARVVIVGGGYIGLETAATCRKLGCEVTVLEMGDRIMNRVVAPRVSEYFTAEHAAHGVSIVCAARVAALEGGSSVERVVCEDGSVYAADLVVVGRRLHESSLAALRTALAAGVGRQCVRAGEGRRAEHAGTRRRARSDPLVLVGPI